MVSQDGREPMLWLVMMVENPCYGWSLRTHVMVGQDGREPMLWLVMFWLGLMAKRIGVMPLI